MELTGLNVGFAMTGSFCTFQKVIPQIERLVALGAEVTPVMSEISYVTDTRFGKAAEFVAKLTAITGKPVIHTIKDAEPIGPKNLLDAMVVAPCTGNTLAKLASGMTDSCVAMAAKASLRNQNPLLIAVSTNDGLGASAQNLGVLLNAKNVYFVPFAQDDPVKKPNSLVALMDLVPDALMAALDGEQLQPVITRR